MSDIETTREQIFAVRARLDDGDKQMHSAEQRRHSLAETVSWLANSVHTASLLAGAEFAVDAERVWDEIHNANGSYTAAAEAVRPLWGDSINGYTTDARSWVLAARNESGEDKAGEVAAKVWELQKEVSTALADIRDKVGELVVLIAQLEGDIAVTLLDSSQAAAALEGYDRQITGY